MHKINEAITNLALSECKVWIGLSSCSFIPLQPPIFDHFPDGTCIAIRLIMISFSLIPDGTVDGHGKEWMNHGIVKHSSLVLICAITGKCKSPILSNNQNK